MEANEQPQNLRTNEIRQFEKTLFSKGANLRTKPVPTSIAPTSIPCKLGNGHGKTFAITLTAVNRLLAYSEQMHELAVIMFSGTLRVSEALNIKSHHYSTANYFTIKGSKKSHDKFFIVSSELKYCQRSKLRGIHPFDDLNRFTVYRVFKKFGIEGKFENSSKNSVTHVFRHQAAQSGRLLEASEASISANLGHKVLKTTGLYGR